MNTEIHDSTTCTAGKFAQPCEMCQFAQNARQTVSGLFGVEQGEKIDSSPPSASEIAVSAPNFDHEWREAPRSMKDYVEREVAEKWLMRGVWLGIQYERERGLLAVNQNLKEMQRMAREKIEK